MIDQHSVNETLKHLNLIDIGVRKCPDCGLELPKKEKECEDCGQFMYKDSQERQA